MDEDTPVKPRIARLSTPSLAHAVQVIKPMWQSRNTLPARSRQSTRFRSLMPGIDTSETTAETSLPSRRELFGSMASMPDRRETMARRTNFEAAESSGRSPWGSEVFSEPSRTPKSSSVQSADKSLVVYDHAWLMEMANQYDLSRPMDVLFETYRYVGKALKLLGILAFIAFYQRVFIEYFLGPAKFQPMVHNCYEKYLIWW